MHWFEGKKVVVTGGSTGIGAAFARQLARAGAELALVARTTNSLNATAELLKRAHAVRVETVSVDLTSVGGVQRLVDALDERGFDADVLINNAGFASYGRFTEQPIATQLQQIALNVSSLVELTWQLLPGLLQRQGGLIQVASTAAFQPVPYMAVYGATKAFVLSFSDALWAEYGASGLKVLALCPGATDTPFFERVGAEEAALGAKASPDEVVALALESFLSCRPVVVHGWRNVAGTFAARFLTRRRAALVTEKLMRPRRAAPVKVLGGAR